MRRELIKEFDKRRNRLLGYNNMIRDCELLLKRLDEDDEMKKYLVKVAEKLNEAFEKELYKGKTE